MNKLAYIALSLVCFAQIGCATNPLDGPLVTLKVTVTGEYGEPIKEATVKGLFRTTRGSGDKVDEALTDDFGRASVTGVTPFAVFLSVNKDGYYKSQFDRIDVSEPPSYGELIPRTRSRDVTLRQIVNPRPLIARRLENITIPLKDEWVGFDLEQGDWVVPHGIGESRDVLFRFSNEFLGYKIDEPKLSEVINIAQRLAENRGEKWTEQRQKHTYGEWSGRLEISFPGDKEGILTMNDSNGYVAESEMRLPHHAPEDGYKQSITWNGVRNGQFMPHNGDGYFLRVRVKQLNDRITEANYAKINEEIDFDPRGQVSFLYYFNPDVNDYNLEFDRSRNLFPIEDYADRIRLP